MKHHPLAGIAMLLLLSITLHAEPVPDPAVKTAALESKAVEKDGVSVVVSLKAASIAADEQPQFIVRFSNVSRDYINLYDVDAYFDWQIAFENTDKQAKHPGPWLLKMDKIKGRFPLSHKQIKAAENMELSVNLNEPPFTFRFVHAGDQYRSVPSVRHLAPGTYRMQMTIKLKNPFGPEHHLWEGPLTTEAVTLKVDKPDKNAEKAQPSPREVAAWDEAIKRVTDKLQPGGLWLNGRFAEIKLPGNAVLEDVLDAAINQSTLQSKAYRVLRVQAFSRDNLPKTATGSAVLVQIGKTHQVVVVFPFEENGWWSRFYDAEVAKVEGQSDKPSR